MKHDISTLGHPLEGVEHRHHRLRMALSLVAALAGAIAMLGIVFVAIGTVTPAEAGITYAVILVLLGIWLTGIWWRWDSPDVRDPGSERERRGF